MRARRKEKEHMANGDTYIVKSEKRLLTPKETAQILGISVKTLYTRSAPKAKKPLGLKAKRIGGSLRFYSEDVYEYIENLDETRG